MSKVIFLKYDDFSDASLLQLNGNTSIINNQLILTPAATWQRGSAYYGTRICLSDTLSFSTYFVFYITHPNTEYGDGLTFTIQAQEKTSLGDWGGGLGYQTILPSIAIEFDTFKNNSHADYNNNHVGIDVSGNLTSLAYYNLGLSNMNIADGTSYHVWLDYNNPLLEVRISKSNVRPASAVLSRSLDVRQLIGSNKIFAGFTAGSGSNAERHAIVRWYFAGSYDPIDIVNNTYIDAPKLVSRSIASSNTNPAIALSGDTVFLDFTANRALSAISVTINNKTAAVVSTGGTSYRATYTMTDADTRGNITFAIAFADTDGNPGTPVYCTTDASAVMFLSPSRGISLF